jgi:diaminopimelate decarboxylase
MTPDPLQLLPLSAARAADGALTLGGCSLAELAQRYGTPLYIYDAATLDGAAASYQATLANVYPGAWEVAYAAKAWFNTATARWAATRSLGLDVVSAGELAIALHGGFPSERIHFHGNNKRPDELAAALAAGVGRIVVDHAGELALLNELALAQGRRQPIWLRVNPDVDVDTHGHTRTGHATSKFGLALADGTAEVVARQALAMPGVALLGLHCHIGSQFRQAAPLVLAVQRLLDLAARLHTATGWRLAELSPGGGWAVSYVPHQAVGLPAVAEYVGQVAAAVTEGCQQHGLRLPRLVLEPGRSLVARAGVALYSVGAVKQAGDVIYAFIDGGLADNPRPALYDARYSALLANRLSDEAPQRVHVAGPYCETGDVLIHDIDLPPLRPGDRLAVPASGAYQLSMASNYNAALRPAVVWVDHGQAQLIQRRETVADLLLRDV